MKAFSALLVAFIVAASAARAAPAHSAPTTSAPMRSPGPSAEPLIRPTSNGKILGGIHATQREIALTLDDGYNPDPKLIDYLQQRHLHGTAFIVGVVAVRHPDFVRRVAALGWMVCSHTYDHKILTHLNDYEIRGEIVAGVRAVSSVVGYACPYFRAPGGEVNARVLAITDSLHLRVVGWDTSISDWVPHISPSEQVKIAFQFLHPGAILLGHWGGEHSFVVLRQVIERLLASGYKIGSVDELLHGTIPTPGPLTLAVHRRPGPTRPILHAASGHDIGYVRRLDNPLDVTLIGVLVLLVAYIARVEHVRRRRTRRRRAVAAAQKEDDFPRPAERVAPGGVSEQ